MEVESFELRSLPYVGVNQKAFFEVLGKNRFLLMYDTTGGHTYIHIDSPIQEKYITALENSISGLEFNKSIKTLNIDNQVSVSVPYVKTTEEQHYIFDDIFKVVRNKGVLLIAFIPQEEESTISTKKNVEKLLTEFETKRSATVHQSRFSNVSAQYDVFKDSEDSLVLNDILESINMSITKNGIAYKLFLVSGQGQNEINEYLGSRVLMLNSMKVVVDSTKTLLHNLEKIKAFTVGFSIANRMFGLYGPDKIEYPLSTINPRTSGDVELGRYLDNSVTPTDCKIMIGRDTLNLGCIISGLPGTGKSREAMAIIDSICSESSKKKPNIVILSPTDEWDDFAVEHNMHLIKLQKDRVPINFFRCPDNIEVSKFYTDLSVIMSAAATSGPYRDPLEKCLINAFRRVYGKTQEPNPSYVFDEIIESVIKLHAKRNNAGTKYTKHGENIKSALEGLLEILSRREYSETRGIHIEDLIKDGVVFNLSNSGVSTKKYLYSMVLNQIYAITSAFDHNGNSELRMLICIEESQTMFQDSKSPVIEDINHRIQDFRKKGICLMLLTHNITDIDQSVRRLCQTKIYFKQAPDMAPIVARDIMLADSTDEEITKKIRSLDSRIGALNYMSNGSNGRVTHNTIFMMTKEYDGYSAYTKDQTSQIHLTSQARMSKDIPVDIHFSYLKGIKVLPEKVTGIRFIRVRYLGEPIIEKSLDSNPTRLNLMPDRLYCLDLLDERLKPIKSVKIFSQKIVRVEIP